MNNTVKNLNLTTIQEMAARFDDGYVDSSLFISMDYSNCGNRFLSTGQPYLLGEGRVLRIISGNASAFINLEHRRLEPQMCFVVPPHSVFEIERLSEDFQLQVFSFSEFPKVIELHRFFGFRLADSQWQLSDHYFNLIWQESQSKPLNMFIIHHLQFALLARLEEYYHSSEEAVFGRQDHAQLKIFLRFMELINEYGTREHFIGFYANEIGISPNYLGNIVKTISNTTSAELINRNLIMRAKVMLKYSDKPAWEISDELNFPNPSAFSKFFKREVGMTPLSYRKL